MRQVPVITYITEAVNTCSLFALCLKVNKTKTPEDFPVVEKRPESGDSSH